MGIDEQHYVGILYMDCPFCESGNIKKVFLKIMVKLLK